VIWYGHVPASRFAAAGDSSYSFNLKRMDSHGGWISSSLDLTRFGLCVDGISSYHKVLSAGSIAVGRALAAGLRCRLRGQHINQHWLERVHDPEARNVGDGVWDLQTRAR
jgi:hypothetical protein